LLATAVVVIHHHRWSMSGMPHLVGRVTRATRNAPQANNKYHQCYDDDHVNDNEWRGSEYLLALVTASGALVLVVVEEVAINALSFVHCIIHSLNHSSNLPVVMRID
jgi:hypothetical protein